MLKAVAGFAGLLLITVALVAIAVAALRSTAMNERKVFLDYSETVRLAERLHFTGERMVAATRGYLLSGDREFQVKERAAREEFERTLTDIQKKVQTVEGNALIRQVEDGVRAYDEALVQMFALTPVVPPSPERQRGFEEVLVPRRQQLDESLASLVGFAQQRLGQELQAASQATSRAVIGLTSIGAAGLCLGLWFAWASTRRLTSLYRTVELDREHAQRAVTARNELLGVIAHDLRSPMSAILMKAALIRKSAPPDTGGATLRHAQSIENTALRMEHLVKSLLDAATIENQQLAVSPTRCATRDLLDATFDLFEPLASRKSIRLEHPLVRGDVEVAADRERTLQVLANLVDNAIKFTPEGGTITLRAEPAGSEVRFAVADTGPGITEEHRSHLFERYWRAEKGGRRGAGLGLYISKGIVDAHGGRIWVDSRPAQGSTFYFTLPMAEPAPAPVREPELPSPAAGPPP